MDRRRTDDTHERLSALEVDVRHLDSRLQALDSQMEEGFRSIRNAVTAQKQPITAFAGWAAVILSLVFAFGRPLQQADVRLRDRVDMISDRELLNAYNRGRANQRFATLEKQLMAAMDLLRAESKFVQFPHAAGRRGE